MHLPPVRCEAAAECARGDSRAFSLVELLVVMAIMGMMLALTMSVGPGLIRGGGVSGGLSQVASAVSLARSEAVRSRKPTMFVLAPTNSNPLDERSYSAYAIIQADSASGTNFTYVTRWQKLPKGVHFYPPDSTNISLNAAPFNSVPYPTSNGGRVNLPGIAFAPDGGLDDRVHTETVNTRPQIALHAGSRLTATDSPVYQGEYYTNRVLVNRLTGKVLVKRGEE